MVFNKVEILKVVTLFSDRTLCKFVVGTDLHKHQLPSLHYKNFTEGCLLTCTAEKDSQTLRTFPIYFQVLTD